ncbi:MAG: hypothetical protein HZA51_18505 [Planctomycetes bacterium]|nr:hypothetical protein [Planctomycetota bacterium]
MMRILLRASFVVVWGAMLPGCSVGKSYNEGRRAEDRGEPHVAYDQYCKAAATTRGGAPASGMARVRASASAYWESQALLEMDAGNYGEAWRMLMKALDIQPNSTTTAQLIRQIELQHHDQIASARTEWMRRGPVALASALKPPRREQIEPAPLEPDTPDKPVDEMSQVAMASPAPKPSTSKEQDDSTTSPNAELRLSRRPPAEIPERENPVEEPGRDERDSVYQEPSVRLTPAPVEQVPEKPIVRPTTQRPDDEAPRAKVVTRKPARPPIRKPDVRDGGRSEFIVMESMSLTDKSLSRGMAAIEGITILLRDTDDDDEADFDLYMGKERMKKIRGLKLGRSAVFAGPSGALYRLTLLGIHHKSRTVRVGIRPA